MDAAARDQEGSMFSGRHFVHSVIPAARTLASNLSFPDLQEMMPQRARRPLHESALGSPILATVAEAVHQAKARGHRQEMNPMMGKGEARYTLTPVPSLAEHSKSLPEQSHLRANCPRDGLATGSTRRSAF
jgi:hypothetical protein